jgi:hypothetical protein
MKREGYCTGVENFRKRELKITFEKEKKDYEKNAGAKPAVLSFLNKVNAMC